MNDDLKDKEKLNNENESKDETVLDNNEDFEIDSIDSLEETLKSISKASDDEQLHDIVDSILKVTKKRNNILTFLKHGLEEIIIYLISFFISYAFFFNNIKTERKYYFIIFILLVSLLFTFVRGLIRTSKKIVLNFKFLIIARLSAACINIFLVYELLNLMNYITFDSLSSYLFYMIISLIITQLIEYLYSKHKLNRFMKKVIKRKD